MDNYTGNNLPQMNANDPFNGSASNVYGPYNNYPNGAVPNYFGTDPNFPNYQNMPPYNPYPQDNGGMYNGYQQNPNNQNNWNAQPQFQQPYPNQPGQYPQWNNTGFQPMPQYPYQPYPGNMINPYQQPPQQPQQNMAGKKFCKHCGTVIDSSCIICPACGKQVEDLPNAQPNIVIQNTNENINTNTVTYLGRGKLCNKWVSFLLCFFLGIFGAHKFYEGKVIMGLIYFFTGGLLGIGWLIDTISILLKPNPYIV